MKKYFITFFTLLIILNGCTYYSPVSQDNHHKKNYKMSYDAKVLFSEALRLFEKDKKQEAIVKFKEFVRLYPDLPQGYYNLGIVHASLKEYRQAVENWEKSVNLDSSNADAYFNLAEGYRFLYNNKKSIKNYQEYLTLRPNDEKKSEILKVISALQQSNIGQGIIGKIFLTNKNGIKNNIPVHSTAVFNGMDDEIYSYIEILDISNAPEILVKWNYFINDNYKIEVNKAKILPKKVENELISIKKPSNGWVKGKYNFEIYVNDELNSEMVYYVQ